jgi:hypothetical protein
MGKLLMDLSEDPVRGCFCSDLTADTSRGIQIAIVRLRDWDEPAREDLLHQQEGTKRW